MKRFLIFVALGPFIAAMLVVVLFSASFLDWLRREDVSLLALWVFVGCYVLGIGPLLMAAVLDWWLESKDIEHRIGLCGLFGFVICTLLVMTLAQEAHWQLIGMLGLVGAIPSAICSWLSGKSAA
jgi:hypothetical protein